MRAALFILGFVALGLALGLALWPLETSEVAGLKLGDISLGPLSVDAAVDCGSLLIPKESTDGRVQAGLDAVCKGPREDQAQKVFAAGVVGLSLIHI